MARILHLEDNPQVLAKVAKLLGEAGHNVVAHTSFNSAKKDKRPYDLYICGSLGKYSDGLIFALGRVERGFRVVVLAPKRKFSRLRFINVGDLDLLPSRILEMFEEVLAEG